MVLIVDFWPKRVYSYGCGVNSEKDETLDCGARRWLQDYISCDSIKTLLRVLIKACFYLVMV